MTLIVKVFAIVEGMSDNHFALNIFYYDACCIGDPLLLDSKTLRLV